MEPLKLEQHPGLYKLALYELELPVLFVGRKSLKVLSMNEAGLKYFNLKTPLEGVTWPGVLSLINVPPHVNLRKFEPTGNGYKAHSNLKLHLQFQDSATFEDRYIDIQLIMYFEPGCDELAVIIYEKTAEQQAKQSRSEFVALSSHQLRTPLSAGAWNLDIFLKRYRNSISKEQAHILDNVAMSFSRMKHLVDALMSVTKIETGKLETKLRLTNIVELLERVIKEATPEAEKRKIKLIISFHQNLPKIMVDETLVKYLFLNLIYNAIKYSHTGGEITIFMSKRSGVIIVQIADHGIGIPKNLQHDVFRRFFRAPDAIKKEPNGSGLGLYLAKMIVEKSGGSIWFESMQDKGTTFWLTLPINATKEKK